MRIISSISWRDWNTLGTFKAGTPIRFKHAFHEKHMPEDIFVVNAVCSSYRPDESRYGGKIAVTNLRTGELAYVDSRRDAAYIECHVKLEEVEDGCPC